MTFTDSDRSVLELCERNCRENVADASLYSVAQLEWGADLAGGTDENAVRSGAYDTVFATDCLYNIQSLPPLLQTASALLRTGGYFIISHVPRASVETDDGFSSVVASAQILERSIVKKARRYSLEVYPGLSSIRPEDLRPLWGGRAIDEDGASFDHMAGIGAAVLIFRKQ